MFNLMFFYYFGLSNLEHEGAFIIMIFLNDDNKIKCVTNNYNTIFVITNCLRKILLGYDFQKKKHFKTKLLLKNLFCFEFFAILQIFLDQIEIQTKLFHN